MILDFEADSSPSVFNADLCIIGAGAAGLTLAAEFLNTNIRVLLLESGGLSIDASTQELYDVENIGLARQPMILQRLRMFGGTTNHWDGRCAPLDPIDFETRAWIPHSGWPISRADLDPFYRRAHNVCDLPSTLQNGEAAAAIGLPPMPINCNELKLQTWQMSPPTRFGAKYRKPLELAPNITVVLHANVTKIALAPNSTQVSHVDISTLAGRKGTVKAPRFVLACGGIENPRLLLASLRDQLGTHEAFDLIGRYFMEHLRTKYVAVPVGDDYLFRTIFNEYKISRGDFLSGLRLDEDAQRAKLVGNMGVMSYTEGGENSPTNSAFRIAKQLANGSAPEHLGRDVINVLSDINSLIVNVRRHVLMPGSETIEKSLVALVLESEQAPNPDSRINLSSATDALGIPKAKVDWRLCETDLLTTQTGVQTLAQQLAAHFNVRIRIPEWLSSPYGNWSEQFRDVSHHMGTTRMADDPRHGVVDKNCRMHLLQNLYVAGSSVFPTGGHVNPTLTIVALALRLADHLKQTIGKEG